MSSSKKIKAFETLRTPPCLAMDIDWSAQHVLVVGMGESGLASCRWLLRKGARVSAIDSRAQPPMEARFRALDAAGRLALATGVATPFDPGRWLDTITIVLPSPGLTPHAARDSVVAGLLEQARMRGLTVVGELDVFEWAIHHAAHASSALATEADLALPLELPKVLAITGTNGKTTTTQMTTALLRRAGFDVQEAGNISPSLLDAVMQREDESRFPQVWVLELSSFQLAYAQHFQPTAAALLNISEDHLDWHLDMGDYIDAKMRVFGIGVDPQTSGVLRVLPRDGGPKTDGTGHDLSLRHAEHATSTRPSAQLPAITFGLDVPRQPGDLGLIEEGLVWMAMRDLHDEERLHRLMPADALRVRGRHNTMNALAALALCRAVTPALAPLLHACREFRGGAHRTEWVANVAGVDFVDDSKGTNVGATAAALQGIGLPVVLIAGGEGKGQDFAPLRGPMAKHAKAVITIGKDGPPIAVMATQAGVATQAAGSMEEAVNLAFQHAAQGGGHGVVLMSPACASFDMFANYVARGHAFRAAVEQLAQSQGVTC